MNSKLTEGAKEALGSMVMGIEITHEEFENAMEIALESIPNELFEHVTNCIIAIEDEPPSDEPDLLGVYDGIPLSERDSGYSGALPDQIILFKNPLQDMCETREELIEEIRITIVHEIAHFFGIDDDRLTELGYE